MKEKYEKIKSEILEFQVKNVITTSGKDDDYIELPEQDF